MRPDAIEQLVLSLWNERDNTFVHLDQPVLHELPEWAELTTQDFAVALEQRADCLQKLATKPGIGMGQIYEAINELREQERSGLRPSLKLGH